MYLAGVLDTTAVMLQQAAWRGDRGGADPRARVLSAVVRSISQPDAPAADRAITWLLLEVAAVMSVVTVEGEDVLTDLEAFIYGYRAACSA